ncbi:hypothetical protein D5H75_18365 [Bailinhaonella thermotolerans]|uniref:G5 domain-containing protein n=2 Tax=Bailinhaonella thermotolerans TaxID=1070861 RepID=A0A3A4BCB5_9ACTN|nr:hypothetical protein D5H75_18365 [Bailinhaonella thermotolerans]
MGAIVGAAVAVVVVILLIAGALAPDPPAAEPSLAADRSSSSPAAEPQSASAAASPAASAPVTPASETRTVTETRKIPFPVRRVRDPALAEGVTKVRRRGVPGVRTLRYEVTVENGVSKGRKLLGETVTRKPVTQIVVVGTKRPQAPRCHPNYGGACVPIASDVDCAGGGGNGPAYVSGPVRVIGEDVYDLDRDGDGIACD